MTTAPTDLFAKPPSPYSVFRHRDFRLMWTGQFVSTAGTALTRAASVGSPMAWLSSADSVASLLLSLIHI